MTAIADRALEQRRNALARANDVRARRARLKRAIWLNPPVLVVFVRRPPEWLQDAQVRVMLAAIPYLGQGRRMGGKQAAINETLRAAGCDRLATFRALRRPQREALAAEVERLTARFRPAEEHAA